MTNSTKRSVPAWLRACAWVAAAAIAPALAGCAVLTVGGAVVGAAITVTGAVVATGVELTGKAVGAGIDALSDEEEPDDSGISIRYTERPASAAMPASAPGAAPLAALPAAARASAPEPARPSPVR